MLRACCLHVTFFLDFPFPASPGPQEDKRKSEELRLTELQEEKASQDYKRLLEGLGGGGCANPRCLFAPVHACTLSMIGAWLNCVCW